MIPTKYSRWMIGLGLAVLLSSCGPGNGEGLDADGNLIVEGRDDPVGEDSGGDSGGSCVADSGNADATLSWVQANVFGGVCSQCHTGGGALGVDWDSESNTCSNVDSDSNEISSMKEIDRCNPDDSYLIWKLEGAGPNGEAIVGGRMPLGNEPLNSDTIQNMRDWIADGTPGCSSSRAQERNDVISTEFDILKRDETPLVEGSWKHVWEKSLRSCTLCHSINPTSLSCKSDMECPPKGLVLTEDNYHGVVDNDIVKPFDLEGSRLWQSITHDNPEQRMPLGYAALTQNQQGIIKNWIEQGAPHCVENQVCP